MKSLLFALALTVTTSSSFAICVPSLTAGLSVDVKTVIEGTETTGHAARQELRKSNPTFIKDELGRAMYSESARKVSDVQSIEIEKHEIYSNSRIERYCSETAGQKNAKCVSFCARWTNYLSRP